MDIADLSRDEQTVLVLLVRHLVLADGEVSDSELYDLLDLGHSIGRDAYGEMLRSTDGVHEDRALVLAQAETVERSAAREAIRTVLVRVAEGDGLHRTEQNVLDALDARWS